MRPRLEASALLLFFTMHSQEMSTSFHFCLYPEVILNDNDIRESCDNKHNWARKAFWDFCPPIVRITRFPSGFRLKVSRFAVVVSLASVKCLFFSQALSPSNKFSLPHSYVSKLKLQIPQKSSTDGRIIFTEWIYSRHVQTLTAEMSKIKTNRWNAAPKVKTGLVGYLIRLTARKWGSGYVWPEVIFFFSALRASLMLLRRGSLSQSREKNNLWHPGYHTPCIS